MTYPADNQFLNKDWLGLSIGNSRLHWAWFSGAQLVHTWDSKHLSSAVSQTLPQEVIPLKVPRQLPLLLASVVPQQTSLWQTYPYVKQMTVEQIPLKGIYATLGIDRALSLWGAGSRYGFPCLVIDAGTALTFTGADERCQLIGGAIMPGLELQLQSLTHKTAALPKVMLSEQLPQRWALDTQQAIASGIAYTVLAGIKDFIGDWRLQFPTSSIVLTGGDAPLLHQYLHQSSQIVAILTIDLNIIFWGMQTAHKLYGEQRNCELPD